MPALLWIAAAYIAIGFLLTAFGPLRKDLEVKILVMVATNPDVPYWKATVLRFVVLSGVVFLWAFFLPAFFRKDGQANSNLGPEHVTPGIGIAGRELWFGHIGGVGKIGCVDCGYAEDITSFTHGSVGSSTGYQCQTCGKFAARHYRQPFSEDSSESRIEHVLMLMEHVESQMEKLPEKEWMERWESDLAKARDDLSHVPEDELARIKRVRNEVNSQHEASLFCECGGKLDREKVLFCPGCRSTHLSYDMEYIT
jgi:hypothetical protein